MGNVPKKIGSMSRKLGRYSDCGDEDRSTEVP